MSHPDSDVVRRQELLLEARDGMAMELGDRWRIVQKPVNRSCQSPRCEIRSGDGNSLGRRLGPLAEDLSRSAVIKAHDWCSQSKRLGKTQSRFLMEGWVEQCSRGGEARQHRATRIHPSKCTLSAIPHRLAAR